MKKGNYCIFNWPGTHRYTRTPPRKGLWKKSRGELPFLLVPPHNVIVAVADAFSAGRPCSRLIGFHLSNNNAETIAIIKATTTTTTEPPSMAIVMQF